jgi:hypothetical protein
MLIKFGKKLPVFGGKWIPAIWECDICKKHFQVSNGRARESYKKQQSKFCSDRCRLKHQQTWGVERLKQWSKKVGKFAHYENGTGLTTDGYVWIYKPNLGYFHNQVKLHRYLMERKIGRRLKPTEIVHHLNFDKLDNRIENLIIVSRKEHNKIHQSMKGKDKCPNLCSEYALLV